MRGIMWRPWSAKGPRPTCTMTSNLRDGEPAELDDIGLLDLWPIETGEKMDVRIGWRLKGLIHDLRIYDRPLSEEEIRAVFTVARRCAS